MKIAQVCPYDMDRPGGVQSHIRDMAAAFRELGHEVTVIAPRNPDGGTGGAAAAGVETLGRARRILFGATQFEITAAFRDDLRRLKTMMREGGFDVVHYHTFWTPILPLQAYLASDAAAVATFHDTPAPTVTGRMLRVLFRGLSRVILPWFDEVVVVSESPLRHLRGAKRPINVMVPGSDLARFDRTPPAPRQFGDGRVNIVFVGRLEERKGVPILLEAYRRLVADGEPVRLIIAGGGPDEPAHRAFVAAHGLDVVFTGRFPDSDKARWYREADIVAAPSPFGESFGMVLVEAMANGKPVVAARNTGYRTVLTGPGAEFLVAPGDPGALAAGLRRLVRDPELRARLGAWGRAEAVKYDCRTVAPDMVAVYRRAMATRSRAVTPGLVAKVQADD